MEVSTEPPTFLLARQNQPLPCAPDVLGQCPCMQQEGKLSGQILQHAPVGGRSGVAGSA